MSRYTTFYITIINPKFHAAIVGIHVHVSETSDNWNYVMSEKDQTTNNIRFHSRKESQLRERVRGLLTGIYNEHTHYMCVLVLDNACKHAHTHRYTHTASDAYRHAQYTNVQNIIHVYAHKRAKGLWQLVGWGTATCRNTCTVRKPLKPGQAARPVGSQTRRGALHACTCTCVHVHLNPWWWVTHTCTYNGV